MEKIKKIKDLELEHSLWVKEFEKTDLTKGEMLEMADGSIVMFTTPNKSNKITLTSKQNDYVSLEEKSYLDALYLSREAFSITDIEDNTYNVIFDYTSPPEYTPVAFGVRVYYANITLIRV